MLWEYLGSDLKQNTDSGVTKQELHPRFSMVNQLVRSCFTDMVKIHLTAANNVLQHSLC